MGLGLFPAISPNGRLLASVRSSKGPCDFFAYDELVVTDLISGTERTLRSSRSVDVSFLSWAPDSTHLAFDESIGGASRKRVLDVTVARSLDQAAAPAQPGGTDWAAYAGEKRAIGIAPRNGSSARTATVVEFDARSGLDRRVLFTVPGGLAVTNAFDGPENTLVPDESGANVLAIGLVPVDAQVRHGALYRWHTGDPSPTLVADEIWAAAWLESPAS